MSHGSVLPGRRPDKRFFSRVLVLNEFWAMDGMRGRPSGVRLCVGGFSGGVGSLIQFMINDGRLKFWPLWRHPIMVLLESLLPDPDSCLRGALFSVVWILPREVFEQD